MTPLRIVLADDHPLYRAGLRVLLDATADTDVVGEAATGAEVIDIVAQTSPDVVLMDLAMPGIDGVDATRQVTAAHPGIAVLALSMRDDGAAVLAAIRAGARGYLVKGASGDDALRAIRAVARGEIVIGTEVAAAVLDRLADSPNGSHAFPELTDRERDILQLIARGYTNTAIAEALHLSGKTVRNYVSTIFRKIQVTGRVDAVIRAREAGLG